MPCSLLSILCSEYGKVVLERVIKLRAQSLLMDTKRGENLRESHHLDPSVFFIQIAFFLGKKIKKKLVESTIWYPFPLAEYIFPASHHHLQPLIIILLHLLTQQGLSISFANGIFKGSGAISNHALWTKIILIYDLRGVRWHILKGLFPLWHCFQKKWNMELCDSLLFLIFPGSCKVKASQITFFASCTEYVTYVVYTTFFYMI